MFRFADDVAHKNSDDCALKYPQLAQHIETLMQAHSFRYALSIYEIRRIQTDIEDVGTARETIQTLLQPYGWHVGMRDNAVVIQTK